MRKILITLAALVLTASAAFAQTAEQILERMDQVMEKSQGDGLHMFVDLKIPIIGTISSQTWSLGDKIRLEVGIKDEKLITFEDGVTEWTYDAKKIQVTIENAKASDSKDDSEGDAELFTGIADDYDVSITKETPEAWYIHCKKSKASKDKDAPKTMDLVVAKGTYNPISLTTKMKGITLTMRGLSFDVDPAIVTFNPADYPGLTVVDKRESK